MVKIKKAVGVTVYGTAVVILICAVVFGVTGIRTAVVMSGSMEPAIETGSLIFINGKDTDVKKGDIIAFKSGSLEVVHRIIDVTEDGYVTKGDNNSSADVGILPETCVEGTVMFSIPKVGYAVKWLPSAFGYLSSRDYAGNTMTVGNNRINIIEEFIPPDKLEPAAVIPKKVNIENTGKNPCAVRVSAEFSDSDTAGIAALDVDEEHWEYRNDGYYYYKEILEPGDITHTLINTVTISETAEKNQLKDFELMISAESRNAEVGDDISALSWKI